MKIGNKEFDVKGSAYIMGILNVTPDSFFDGGKYTEFEECKKYIEEMIRDGVDIIDVGGESTRPGFQPVTAEEEIARVVPVISYITEHYDVPVSIDTQKSEVARAALLAGATMVNDVTGLKHDPLMAGVVAEFDAAVCIMSDCPFTSVETLKAEMDADFATELAIARAAGIKDERIIYDPGIGFHSRLDGAPEGRNEADRYIAGHITDFMNEFPMLYAHSNKSYLRVKPDMSKEEMLLATVMTTGIVTAAGVSFVRVHDVKANKAAVETALMVRAMSGGKA